MAQCPLNIGFETGTLQNWECSSGTVAFNGTISLPLTGAAPYQHIITRKFSPEDLDQYGHFPITCPNGGKYSFRLGNDEASWGAERVSYTFVVPANQNDYNIIYNYAIVFQDPGHVPYQQPRFSARVFDVAANDYINCPSFDFIASSDIPGFILSDIRSSDNQKNIYYKPWSSATIKLAGYAGKTIRLEFTTNDCTQGAHFGYAYIDVNDNCSSAVRGNIHCAGYASTLLTAPLGYKEYSWYNAGFTALLGSASTLNIKPSPPAGTVYAVIMKPYDASALACTDTVYTTITAISTVFDFKVIDSAKYCLPAFANLTAPAVTSGSSPGLTYTYFNDLSQLDFIARPDSITHSGIYYIRAANNEGCTDIKPVNVIVSDVPDFIVNDPPVVYYPQKADLANTAILTGNISGLSFSYWGNAAATRPLQNFNAIDSSGIYYIKATNSGGCSVIKPVKVVVSIPPPPNIFSPNGDGMHDQWEVRGLKQYSQCSVEIFNRWGQVVFRSTGYSKPWDGKIRGKKLSVGTYYYVIKLPGQSFPLTGYVDIIY